MITLIVCLLRQVGKWGKYGRCGEYIFEGYSCRKVREIEDKQMKSIKIIIHSMR